MDPRISPARHLLAVLVLAMLTPPLLGCLQCQEAALPKKADAAESPPNTASDKPKLCGRLILARSAGAVAQPCETTYDLMTRMKLSRAQIKFVHENGQL